MLDNTNVNANPTAGDEIAKDPSANTNTREESSLGTKRPAGTETKTGPSKRRNAYTPRACDCCRRRKGKCDGRRPCEHCIARGRTCTYSLSISSWPGVQGNTDMESTQLHVPNSQPVTSSLWMQDLISSMGSAILSLQTKLDGLTALIQESDGHQTATNTMNPVNGAPTTLAAAATVPANGPEANSVSNNDGYQPSQDMTRPSLHAPCVARSPAVSCRTARHFYGPTSPYFSLNMAQNKVSDKTSPKARESTERLPSIDQDDSDGDEMEDDNASHISSSSCRKTSTGRGVNVMPWADLFKLPFHLTLQETVRLLEVYQEVVGEFHPILDITFLIHLAERWYAWSRSGAADIGKAGSSDVGDEDSYLALILVIAIALRAENTLPQSKIFKQIHNSCCANVNAKLVSPATNVTDVVIALLAALLYFFDGTTRMAWRICGLAGSMVMELGLHTREVTQRLLESSQERVDAANIICTIVTLDRQWSAATGLPAHFKESMFDPDLLSLVQQPYLKAMMPFLHISDKVSGMISRVMQGQSYDDDDDAFEVTNFEIEQWRRKAVGQYAPGLLGLGSSPCPQAPSWASLLYLRANSVKGMLLRPLFFSNSCASGDRNIKPALELVSNTIQTLVTLDNLSDIYRKQHAYYQHILAGSCALLFLVVAYVEQNQKMPDHSLPAEIVHSIKQSYSRALGLASTYSGSQQSSRGLLRRLVLMKPPLIKLGILPANSDLPDLSMPLLSTPQQLKTQMPLTRAPAETSHARFSGSTSLRPYGVDAGMIRATNVNAYDDRFAASVPSYPGSTSMMMMGRQMDGGDVPNLNWNDVSSSLGQWAFAGEDDFFSYASL